MTIKDELDAVEEALDKQAEFLEDVKLTLSIEEFDARFIEPARKQLAQQMIDAQIESWHSTIH